MSYWLEAGGSERQLTEIALGLDRSRYEPHVGVFRVPRDYNMNAFGALAFQSYNFLCGLLRSLHDNIRYLRSPVPGGTCH